MTCFISGSLFVVSANFNLVPYTLADFCDLKGCYLRLCSVAFTAQGALLCVMHTKTIQFQQRVLEIPLPYISGTALRPYLANSLCPDQSSLLGCRSHSLFQPILAHQYSAFIKASVAAIGLDPKKYLRIVFVVEAQHLPLPVMHRQLLLKPKGIGKVMHI